MKLKQIKKKFFGDSTKLMSESAGISQPTLRTFLGKDREAKELKDGGFILTSKQTVIFRPEKVKENGKSED
jgi:hypothetical protein